MLRLVNLLKATYSRWSEHNAPRLGASVAFYSILSFAPLLVLLTGLIALVFGHDSAQGALVNQARELMGDRGAETVSSLLKNAQKPGSGILASLFAFATLLFGASGLLGDIKADAKVETDRKAPQQVAAEVVRLARQGAGW